MGHAYLVRYGVMRYVGQFTSETDGYQRGQAVVVQTRRGQELGELLLKLPDPAFAGAPGQPAVLRLASEADLERARVADGDRLARLEACERLLQNGVWPLHLLDVEALLDDGRTVLYYLGPHRLDDAGLRLAMKEATGLDVVLEPAGRDEPLEAELAGADGDTHGCGACGSNGGCGAGGGCGSGSESHGGGCSSCAVKELLARARR